MKHLLLTLLLSFACFAGQGAAAIPASAGEQAQHGKAGIAQGELYAWPGALPELERLYTGQVLPTPAQKQQHIPGFGATTLALEYWLQQGIARRMAIGQLCQVSLSGTRIIFPFHSFW